MSETGASGGRTVGRYVLYDEIASGGLARVLWGRLKGPIGFSRTVAVKCLFPQFTREPEFVSMLIDEAHLASRIRHPNVVSTIDVIAEGADVFVVMEYVHGESLSRLLRRVGERGERVPVAIASAIVGGMLLGLHAAHEATDERGAQLGIVHRDVSPQNVLVGTDGVARVLDFGIAKASTRLQSTVEGQLKGKLRYMSPEQLRNLPVDRRTDVFAASIVLWETLTGRRLFEGDDAGNIVGLILSNSVVPPSRYAADVPAALDEVVLRGLSSDPAARFASALEMAVALEHATPPATVRRVGEWVDGISGPALAERSAKMARIEAGQPPVGSDANRVDEATAPIAVGFDATSAGQSVALAPEKPPKRSRAILGALTLAAVSAFVLAFGWPRLESPALLKRVMVAPRVAVLPPAIPIAPSASPPVETGAPSRSKPVRARAGARSARPADCDPDYEIVNGIKQYKRHCF